MARCAKCGAEHELLDPAFARPDALVALPAAEREEVARATDDVCVIELPGAAPRHFVRGVLPVEVAGFPDGVWWGVWAQLAGNDFARIHQLWSAENQDSEPPYEGELANQIPGYPPTLGLPVSVQLTGPTSRPELRFRGASSHPFVEECRAGVTLHRAADWNALLEGGDGD